MKQTILTTQQSTLLENLIVKHGQIVTTDNIYIQANEWWDQKTTKNIITKLTNNGWLIRIKRGLYAISDLSNRGFLSLSPYLVAHLLVNDSYVSFETALSYHGMFDQLTHKVISIAPMQYKTLQLQEVEYSFVKAKKDWYFGWQEANIDNKATRIATPEKALIDMVQFHKSKYSIDVVVEKIKQHKDSLDSVKMTEYLRKMSMTTIKIFGLLFDIVGFDSSKLFALLKSKSGTHTMLSESVKFNAKWRLYYDPYFDKYQDTDAI
ncbi:hypothetical protein HGA88_06905 [Candidatus Roizmanbacteria bacterium]|nr:hypothetical protein [Candidatus Roizmanbacteria bacterium]